MSTLDSVDAIAPAIDTAAIESYLTIKRLSEDVERLETLDVTGQTVPPQDGSAEATATPAAATAGMVKVNPPR